MQEIIELEEKSQKIYYKYIDIAKGVAIILVVMGHIESTSALYQIWQKFFMLFHVPIFFMISGLTIQEEQIKKPYSYIKNKIKTIYIRAVIFCVLAVIAHNLCCRYGFYNPLLYPGDFRYDIYTNKEIVKQIILTLGCAGREPIMAAMWFVFVLFFSLCGYAILSSILSYFLKNESSYESVRTIIIWGMFVLSAFLTNHYQFTIKRFSNVFAAIALIHLSHILKHYKTIKFDRWEIVLISFIGLIQNMEYGIVLMNLNIYGNPIFLLSNGFFGMYFVCFWSKKIENYKWSTILQICGRHSFWIMALHILSFKIVTILLSKIYVCQVDIGRVTPIMFSWWEIVIYVVLGVMIPVVMEIIIKYTKKTIIGSVK